jgi:hypothetical protein
MSTLSPSFAKKLEQRRPLAIDATRAIAVKRNLHELTIEAGAERFAAALEEVMCEPDARFGMIEVKRLPGREGQPFAVGERFTGCVRLAELAAARGSRWAAALSRTRLGAWLEDSLMSDYAEVVDRAPGRVVYRYLSGCPMAGTSTFTVEPIDAGRCRFRVAFEYQELGGVAISVLHRFGLQLHDQVTHAHASRAAERIGARILSSTI